MSMTITVTVDQAIVDALNSFAADYKNPDGTDKYPATVNEDDRGEALTTDTVKELLLRALDAHPTASYTTQKTNMNTAITAMQTLATPTVVIGGRI